MKIKLKMSNEETNNIKGIFGLLKQKQCIFWGKGIVPWTGLTLLAFYQFITIYNYL